MGSIRRAWSVVLGHRREYTVLNIVYYGLVLCGMVYVAIEPSVQQTLLGATRTAFTEGPLSAVGDAYSGGKVLPAIVLTFAVNLFLGALASITLPSLVIPFSGLLMGGFRALMWGLLLAPTDPTLSKGMIPHSLTLILEGQAYILTMLAAYIQGMAFVQHHRVGAATPGEGYRIGVHRCAHVYLLIVILLAVAAVYEAFEVIYIVGPLARGGS